MTTNEYEYYAEPEPEFDPTETTDWQQRETPPDINLHFCVMTRHDMLRVLSGIARLRGRGGRGAGLRHLVVLAVIKQFGA